MPYISISSLANAIRKNESLNIERKSEICDRIYLEQPNMLASILVLSTLGTPQSHIEKILDVLIVATLALERSNVKLNLVSEKTQEKELQRLVAAIKFSHDLNDELFTNSIRQINAFTKEPHFTAYVVSVITDSKSDFEHHHSLQYSILAALNIASCIASAERQTRN